MSAMPTHEPVMAAEVLAGLDVSPNRLYVDATLGLGGHSELILERGARVVGIDRDREALDFASRRLARHLGTGHFRAIHADYRAITRVLAGAGTGPVDGVLADLGVSSYQLDTADRGFSFRSDSALDMRMDRTESTPTAAEILAAASEHELTRMLRDYGEEKDARRIARAIVTARALAPITTTRGLADIVSLAKPRPRGPQRIHPATLTFQALRIAVNGELEGLASFVVDAVSALRRGARVAIISFHSLEDRPVKTALHGLAQGCVCPTAIVVCRCGREPEVRLLGRRPVQAGEAEVARNPRARSAKLRVAEKITDHVAPELRAA